MLVMQNSDIKKFAENTNIEEHITIYAFACIKRDPECFQVFANVIAILREGFRNLKDKVTLGLTKCKVYDRYVKRCNNCQKYGHYAKDCETPDEKVCGLGSEEHSTRDCESFARRCINCVREGNEEAHHHTSSHVCPA